jgi:hypothetical protein
VLVVSDERVPVQRPARLPKRRVPISSISLPRRESLWGPIAIAALVLFMAVAGLAALTSAHTPARHAVDFGQVPMPQPVHHRPELSVTIPEELKAAPGQDLPEGNEAIEPKAEPLGKAEQAECAVAEPDREAFGTAVAFVRNAHEAARTAQRERKLLCLFHVSGNFEDSRFT